MSALSRILPPEAVSLLEEAQCGTESSASSVLQTLSLRLRAPHPSVTSALHDLLQIYPLPTIPHVPSLIPATPSVVSLFVESFSDLLSADRTLLVPIISALSDLPLSASHATQARATLRYALSVVDTHDLPAVVRALARLCANAKAPASARWAATALRDALNAPPDAHIIPILAHVLDDVCRPGNAVGSALRTQAGIGRVSWLDLVVWIQAVKASDGPYAAGYKQALAGISAAVKGPLLAGDAERLLHAVRSVAPALTRDATGVREFVRIVADELSQLRVPRLEPVVNFARLVQTLVNEVSAAARGIVQELLAPTRAGSVPAECSVLGVVDVLPRDARHMAAASRNVRVRVAVVNREGNGTSAWSSVLVGIRKGLLFGVDEDRSRALSLAREIVRVAEADVVGELLALMDSSVSAELGDELAVGFLEIVTVASLRGMVRARDAERTLEKRIDQQCPKGMIKEVINEGKKAAEGDDQVALHIDIGVIWEQDPMAVAIVISSAASLTLTRWDLFTAERISVGVLNMLCLVPVICIPLYNAVEDCSIEFDTALFSAKRQRGAKLGSMDIPINLLDADSQDLVTAISSFAAGMAAIVGILNTTSLSLTTCRRVMVNRRRSRGLRDGPDQKTRWTLLERLTEFDRMLNALLLGYEVLQKKVAIERKMDKGRKAGSSKARERNRDSANSALNKADSIRDSVLRGISAREGAFDDKQEDLFVLHPKYPQLSLQAIVCSLVAVPDEAGIEEIGDETVCKQTRDIELVRIDKLLLRQMLRLTTGRTAERPSRSRKQDIKATNEHEAWRTSRDHVEASRNEGLECLQRIQDALDNLHEPSSSFPYIDLEVENHENIFTFDDDKFSDEEEADEQGTESAAVRWNAPKCEPGARMAEYVRSTTNAVTRRQWASSHDLGYCVSDIIHSPYLASLLLDRAATYVAVARRGRRMSLEKSFLSNAISVAGFALGCLVIVLRVIPSCGASLTEDQPTHANPAKVGKTGMRTFLKIMDEHLVTGVPRSDHGEFEECLERSKAEGMRSVSTLRWISENSIDAAVSALALETLLVISEYGCLRAGLARHAVLSSLTTIYEYDSSILWAQDDMAILFQDTFGEWCLRRRGCADGNDTNGFDGAERTTEQAPSVGLLSKGTRKHRSIDQYRLHLLFEGMHIPSALLEACGWIREIAMVMLEDPEETNGVEVTSAEKVAFLAEKRAQAKDSKIAKKHDTSRCQDLLEMNGFRNVIATLMQLVQVSLQTLTLSESFGVDDALDVTSSPITHMQSALCVLCGILRLYRMNRASLVTQTEPDTTSDPGTGPDQEFDHYIVSSMISVMQLIRSSLDQLCCWYSNTTTDLSRLSDEVVDGIEKVIGCAALAVKHSSEFSTAIKREYSSIAAEATPRPEAADPGERRPQGCTPSKRKKAGEDDVSRARRILPRLSTSCDAVTKETLKLAKVMGFRTKKALFQFAPPPLEEDSSLCFGVGLDLSEEQEMQLEKTQSGDKREANMTELNGADVTMATAVVGEDGIKERSVSGFPAEACEDEIEAELRPKTVTVQFKR